MKSVFFSAIALMGILLSSCNKEVVTPVKIASEKKLLIKEAWSGYNKDTNTYEYDAQDRLVKLNYSEDTYTLTYNGNAITLKDFRPSENRLVFDATGTLDAGKRITTLNANAAYVANQPYSAQFKYKYGQAGNLLETTDTRSNGTVVKKVYTWANNNISRIDYIINGVLKYYSTFEYFDLPDLTGIDHYKFECAVTDLTGANNKLLIKKATMNYTDNSPAYFVNYMYTLDSQGYPVKTEAKTSFGDVSKVVYSYNK